MRSRLALAALLLAAPLVHGGCASTSSGLPNAPIFNTGASATIIPVGAPAPAMPGYGQQRQTTGGPGQASGSYSTGGSGVPGMGGAPAYGSPGGPPPAARAPEVQMLGGATTIDTTQIRQKEDPLWSNPLFWPFAVVAWPLVKANQAINAEKDAAFRRRAYERIQEQTGVPMPDDSPYGSRTQSQVAQERAEQQAMEQALRQRLGGGETGAAHASAASRPSLSIADELEALRAGASPAPRSAATPAGAAPRPGAAAADVAEDRSGDGRIDRWVYESDGRKRELLDEDGDGRPERTVSYEADGRTIARVDEDANGDGEVDTWSTYQAGQLVRRRADTNGDGEPDTWTAYANGEVVRHEQDTNHDGVRDTVDHYDGGRLARRTLDADGDGRPERITHFDEKGRPASVEEDTDGDGLVDTRSHYAGGKLVRKELLDEAQATR
jgi:hypothetical protein